MHIYWLGGGLFPLDWEFCFLTVSEYKEKLIEKRESNPDYFDLQTGGVDKLFALIDKRVTFALNNFNEELKKYSHELRCPAMIIPIPRGDASNGADFIIILKRDEDGDTAVYSPYPISYLEK
ncbi:hypothetical protein M3685_25785 [Heyndrickxia oleronia]|mgnify:FL=1|uniref:hypothetical protein n=1 Tax=Heyndrickxia TaxID=2837504 RepID=UPI0015D15E44|nr:hypothetical protein [Heyndrickxia oleronia]MBU5214929.1 hypothetical protein [Heyndrickxia oleronia]MCM3457291.1 hypothetical protein [Heyndrickxia oleronia]NYV68745.1 hypothetical protein [Bacillus sp. Gen3]GIN42353.1 hypothetical protein J19TS1_53020 [Heyndrickxia oleronia]